MVARLIAVVVLVIGLLAAPAAAQEPPSTTTTSAEVPAQDIIPAPNTGEEPHEAGDRGGALQLAIFGALVVGIGGAVVVVVRQSRRARAGSS
jgi:uncharacterized protein HemX